jgi:hypothetical protein
LTESLVVFLSNLVGRYSLNFFEECSRACTAAI